MAKISGGYSIEFQIPNDSEIARDRAQRLISSIVAVAVLVFCPAILVGYWGALAGGHSAAMVGGLIGFCAGVWFAHELVPTRILVENGEYEAYVTQDPFTGEMTAYGPGMHLSHFWEQRNAEGTLSLELMSIPIDLTIPTASGPSVRLKGDYQFVRSLKYLQKSVGIDPQRVEDDLVDLIESFLTAWCSGNPLDTILKGGVETLNKALAVKFIGDVAGGFESTYGIKTVGVAIATATPSEAVQKTRDAEDEAVRMFSVVAGLFGITPDVLRARLASTGPDKISREEYKEMLNRAMAVSSNDTTMVIHAVEGNTKGLGLMLGDGNGGKK